MKLLIWTASLAFCCCSVYADTPGKREMQPSNVSFQNVKEWNNYTFYYQFNYGEKRGMLTADTTLSIPGSAGAPDGISLWAINKKTNKSTDTVYFFNHYDPDRVVILTGVKNDSVQYKNADLSNANQMVTTPDTSSIANRQLVQQAEAVKRSHYYTLTAYITAAVIALAGMVWYIIKRKRKTEKP